MLRTSILTVAITLGVCTTLGGCATRGSNYRPIVDAKIKDGTNLTLDTAECQEYAKRTMDGGTAAVIGGLAVGLLTAVLMPRGFRNEAFKIGAVGGAAGAGTSANETQETIIKRCLAGRGYSVLN